MMINKSQKSNNRSVSITKDEINKYSKSLVNLKVSADLNDIIGKIWIRKKTNDCKEF